MLSGLTPMHSRALMQMRRTGQSRLMVLHHGRLFGMVSSRDLLDILSLEQELHGYRSRPTGRRRRNERGGTDRSVPGPA